MAALLSFAIWVVVKAFIVLISAIAIVLLVSFSVKDNSNDEHIDDWAKHSLALFQDAADFFSSFQSDIPEQVDTLDDELNALLPSESIDLRYEPNFDETINLNESDAVSLSPDELLPNLFDVKQASSNSTSVKGQIFTDEKDNVIGGKVQVAIPTDM